MDMVVCGVCTLCDAYCGVGWCGVVCCGVVCRGCMQCVYHVVRGLGCLSVSLCLCLSD